MLTKERFKVHKEAPNEYNWNGKNTSKTQSGNVLLRIEHLWSGPERPNEKQEREEHQRPHQKDRKKEGGKGNEGENNESSKENPEKNYSTSA